MIAELGSHVNYLAMFAVPDVNTSLGQKAAVQWSYNEWLNLVIVPFSIMYTWLEPKWQWGCGLPVNIKENIEGSQLLL